jgi:hypothetical protein
MLSLLSVRLWFRACVRAGSAIEEGKAGRAVGSSAVLLLQGPYAVCTMLRFGFQKNCFTYILFTESLASDQKSIEA